jgi:ATP-dependent Lhr-like helicase
MTVEEFKSALPRTYGALIAHHGQPTGVQLAALTPILSGKDVLICAPTASGKTVAYVAPLVERWCTSGDSAPRIIIVSPTRALVNDLCRRLKERLAQTGVSVGRWTGDHHDGGRMHPVTITTPEGLDSRLSRAPTQLDSVRAVVLDELHVLDNTARGDQLRVLVERLRTERCVRSKDARIHDHINARPPLQVIAASATVPDLQGLAHRYLVLAKIVSTGQRRSICGKILTAKEPEALRKVLFEQVQAGFRKVLVFCNRRKDVESLAQHFNKRAPFAYSVLAHHGSLAKNARLSAEQRFLSSPVGVCFATSTMELGIDIGDVDLVVLYGLPPNIPALLQRAGRGGRRAKGNQILAIAETTFEAHAFRTLLKAQTEGQWFAGPNVFRSSVLAQQAVSILQARPSRTVTPKSFRRRLPADLAAVWPEDRLGDLLQTLCLTQWLRELEGNNLERTFGMGAEAEACWHRGQAHANIGEKGGIPVFDSMTGDEVGRVSKIAKHMALGGKGRQALHASDNRVVTTALRNPGKSQFDASKAFSVPSALATGLLKGVGVPVPCRVHHLGEDLLFHGLGTAGGQLLAAALTYGGLFQRGCTKLRKAGRMSLAIEGQLEPQRWPDPSCVKAALQVEFECLGRSLELGSHHTRLAPDEQREVVAQLCEQSAVEAFIAKGCPPLKELPAIDGTIDLWIQAAHW